MESSRFLQISPDILLEYVYTDQADPDVFNTSSYPIEIMDNDYTDSSYMFNTDIVFNTLGNKRDISVTSINSDKTEYVYLNSSVGVPYNDIDNNLTSTPNLIETFSPNIGIEYDTIKIHFTSGFDFNNYDGLIIESLIPRRDGVNINTSSRAFLKTDTPIFNPDPFLLGSKLYATYIEWKIPSLFYMASKFNSSSSNLLSYKLTNGQGFKSTPPITINFLGIVNTEVDNSYNFFTVEQINSVSLSNRDEYDLLYAEVKESDTGDFFELNGQVNGSTLSDFISSLNGDYAAIHQIIISEQINTTFIKTSNQMFTQTTFDEPIRFRPIILNSANAVSFAINYTLRLFNRSDNTQIIKKARLVSFDPKKYGRKLMKINLGTVPTVAKVYNKINNDNGNNITITNLSNRKNGSNDIVNNTITQTKFVTSFRDRLNIKAAVSPVKIENIKKSDA